jgi:hypothetical protein
VQEYIYIYIYIYELVRETGGEREGATAAEGKRVWVWTSLITAVTQLRQITGRK